MGSGLAGIEIYRTRRTTDDTRLRSRNGEMAESWEDNAELIKEEAFPKPLEGVGRKAQDEGVEMWKKITDQDI